MLGHLTWKIKKLYKLSYPIAGFNKIKTNAMIFKLYRVECILFGIVIATNHVRSRPQGTCDSRPLLMIGIDGLRWDYVRSNKDSLNGFSQLIDNGVMAEYVEPIYPSLTYPSWTTIFSGLYADVHGITGNYMFHLPDEEYSHEAVFNYEREDTQLLPIWWKFGDPLWISALRAGKNVFIANFMYCNYPYDIKPTECIGQVPFASIADNAPLLRNNLNTAVERLKDGFSLAMVYDESFDETVHEHGSNSENFMLALKTVDNLLEELLQNMTKLNMLNKVNIILVSDHGHTTLKKKDAVKHIYMKDYISEVEDHIVKVADFGALANIAVKEGKVDLVFDALSKMPGTSVYKRADVPKELHYKNGRKVNDIVVVTKPGHFVVGLENDKQITNKPCSEIDEKFASSHGYYNMSDMRATFIASGPGFKRGRMHPPIKLVDEYQIFTHLLNIQALPNNGTWENVKDMLVDTQ